MPSRILIVRLSALGDIVHAVPVLAALGRQEPGVEVDWLVEEAYAPVLGLVDGLRRRVIVRARRGPSTSPEVFRDCLRFPAGPIGYARAIAFLRRQHYDAALDLQGLIKSAVWARASGAKRALLLNFGSRSLQCRRFVLDRTTMPHYQGECFDVPTTDAACAVDSKSS